MATAKTKTRVHLKSYTFEAVIEPDKFGDGRKAFHAYIPALEGCHTWGYTVEEALENLEATAKMFIEDMLECGEPVPQNIKVQTQPLITVNIAS